MLEWWGGHRQRHARGLPRAGICGDAAHDPVQPRLRLLLPAACARRTGGCRWRWPRRSRPTSTSGRPGDRFSVVWHGGEPLAAGREHLARADGPVRPGVEHHVQTNATLIDDAWCEFFAEHGMRVSVSVDGPDGPQRRAGDSRAGRPAYDRIVRGIDGAAPARPALRRAVRGGRPAAGPGRPSCTSTSWSWAATCSASTSRSGRASTSAPTPTTPRRCGPSGPSWSRRGAPTRGSTSARWSGRCGTPARCSTARPTTCCRAELDPIPTVGARRRGGAALAGAGGLHRPGTATSAAATCCTTPLSELLAEPAAHQLGRRVPGRGGGVPGHLPVLRLLRRRPRRQPVLRARPVRRHGDRALPQQQDPPTGGSARPCPSTPDRVTDGGSATRDGRAGLPCWRRPRLARGWPEAKRPGARQQRRLRLEPLREHPDVLQLEQPAALRRTGAFSEVSGGAVQSLPLVVHAVVVDGSVLRQRVVRVRLVVVALILVNSDCRCRC